MGEGGGARRWIKKATNVITLTWPMVDKIFLLEKLREKRPKMGKKLLNLSKKITLKSKKVDKGVGAQWGTRQE